MAQTEIKFYGEPAERVIIVYQKDGMKIFNDYEKDFIKMKFNTARNYREFTQATPVTLVEAASDKLPYPTSLKSGDAILLIGDGRFIDEASYNFAISCIDRQIPVYFIRSNVLEFDARVKDELWKHTSMTVKMANGDKHFVAPKRYFMEIPRKKDFILSKFGEKYFALLPGMVPLG